MDNVKVDRVLDARGLQCPMPLVKARKEIGQLQAGQVLKVISTDRGSVKDFQGWAKVTPTIELLDQQTESNDGTNVYVHYVKRAI
jgi:tRNA 2-thiouridine synthesizing protein A